jgi:hypothetical protein
VASIGNANRRGQAVDCTQRHEVRRHRRLASPVTGYGDDRGGLEIVEEGVRGAACDISAGPVLLASLPRKRFDLVISMGVAERLLPDKASQFISLLCELGDVILFSACNSRAGRVQSY